MKTFKAHFITEGKKKKRTVKDRQARRAREERKLERQKSAERQAFMDRPRRKSKFDNVDDYALWKELTTNPVFSPKKRFKSKNRIRTVYQAGKGKSLYQHFVRNMQNLGLNREDLRDVIGRHTAVVAVPQEAPAPIMKASKYSDEEPEDVHERLARIKRERAMAQKIRQDRAKITQSTGSNIWDDIEV